MKIKYLKLKNWLLASVMSLFGLSACHSQKEMTVPEEQDTRTPQERDRDRVRPMYGVPTRDYRVEGIDPADSLPAPKVQPREPEVTVYGVPTVNFAVKGRVVDNHGKPIKGMQVMLINSELDPDNLPDTDFWLQRMKSFTDTTDAEGNFDLQTSDRPWEKVRVLVRDIDGKQNGSYDTQLVDVDFGEPESDGHQPVSSWNLGVKKGEVTVQMTPKK